MLPVSRWTRILLFSLALPVFPGEAQAPAPPARGGTNRHVTLDVVVDDKSGNPVAGLQQLDFTVLDNKQPQTILSFQAVNGTTEPPVEIVLLIDRVNTSFSNSASERIQVDKFLRQNGGHLARPVSMVFFSDSDTQMENASSDGNALAEALNQSDSGLRSLRRSQGFQGAVDRFQLSLRALNWVAAVEAKKPGKKIVIWVSPGWPLLSGPRMDLTVKQEQALFRQIVATSQALWDAHITLNSVDPLGTNDAGGSLTNYYKVFLKGVKQEKQAQIGNLGLQVLAYQSGGRVLNSSNDIAGEIATCIADANSFYVLSYDMPPADGPDEYHELEIKMAKHELKARTRTVYYAQP
jgi:VWFA-related protein